MGCTVTTTFMCVSITKVQATLGTTVDHENPTAAGIFVKSTNYSVSSITVVQVTYCSDSSLIFQDFCIPDTVIMLLQPSFASQPNMFGAYGIFSADSFGQASYIFNLSTALQQATNYSDINIYDAVLLQNKLLLLTSHGVLQSSDVTVSQNATFSVINTGIDSIDAGMNQGRLSYPLYHD